MKDKDNEKQLILRAQKDPKVFGEIFDKYYDPIFGYVLKRTSDVQVSQDIVSETFFKALSKLWQFRWRGISISSWLYRIASNEIKQYYRKKKNFHFSLDQWVDLRGFEGLEFQDDKENILQEIIEQERELTKVKEWKKVMRKIEKLPMKYQEVLVLRYFENKKMSEIAEIMGKKEGTVKSLLSRGIKKIKEECN